MPGRRVRPVVGLGQCSLDMLGRIDAYPPVDQKTEIEQLLVQGGGPVATALVTLARLGVPTAFCGRIGGDAHGRQIRAGLRAEGVDCRKLLVDPEGTSQFAFIAVEAGSGHRNIFWSRGSARSLGAADVDVEFIRSARLLHLDGLAAPASCTAARIARRAGVTTVLDGGTFREGSADLLPLIDHLVVSERFAQAATHCEEPQAALEPLLAHGAQAVTVTCGARGSWTLSRCGEFFHQPAFSVNAVDTTGCGDVFHGGYIYALLQGWPLHRVVAFAAASAALKTRALGGRTAIPSLPEVLTLLVDADGEPSRS
jgi:sulfofructose kinase